jgi:hypothetical protein
LFSHWDRGLTPTAKTNSAAARLFSSVFERFVPPQNFFPVATQSLKAVLFKAILSQSFPNAEQLAVVL